MCCWLTYLTLELLIGLLAYNICKRAKCWLHMPMMIKLPILTFKLNFNTYYTHKNEAKFVELWTYDDIIDFFVCLEIATKK